MIYVSRSMPVNEPGQQHVGREELWQGLVAKAGNALPFVAAMTRGEIVARYPAVQRIACGHVHRHMTMRFGGAILCTAPSTTTALALQLSPEAPTQSYIEPPAFLLHHWTEPTGLVTHWVPIGTFPGPYLFG